MTVLVDMEEVYRFVAEKHAGQTYCGYPFQYHLDRVVEKLVEFKVASSLNIAVGLLHDSIEDTDATREEIEARFGEEIGRRVWACTGIGHNRKARNADIRAKLKECPEAYIPKAADRLANHAASKRVPGTGIPDLSKCQMYLKERAEVEECFRDHIPSAMWDALQQDYADFEKILSRS